VGLELTQERIDGRPSKTIALLQSSYIPWKGYFDLLNSVDEFILFDDAQYTVRDWRNRNRLKTRDGPAWVTIPVQIKGRSRPLIKDVLVSDGTWAERHWRTILHNYSRAPYFAEYRGEFEALYRGCAGERSLSSINYRFIQSICGRLGITTRLLWSMDFTLLEGKTERIVDLCRQRGATRYLSGPSARVYLDERQFTTAGVDVLYADYSGYREYHQLFPPFVHQVSVIDLLFNEGPDARRYMRSFS
jgi:hypothetical protein